MWHLIGIDADGTRHHCNQCKTQEEALKLLEEAMPKLEKMKAPYIGDLVRASMERLEIQKLPKTKRPLYYDYLGWKEQGFFIERFEVEYKEGDY